MSADKLQEYMDLVDEVGVNASNFNPDFIEYQREVIDDIKHHYDYSKGVHVALLSGSVGSAKSILIAHLVVRHCVEFEGACCLISRKSLPDLKETLFLEIQDQLSGAFVQSKNRRFTDGGDYYISESIAAIYFKNGSRIISRSWTDKKYKKFRSLKLSMAVIEEMVENNDEDKNAFKEILMRLGRIPKVCRYENLFIGATNPDSPGHWVYEDIIKKADTNDRYHVYYSNTEKNLFLPREYIESLKDGLDPKEADRMLRGKWIEISSETIYHTYNEKLHFKAKESYEPDQYRDIHIAWDFNVAIGKPLSLCLFQFDGVFHFFNEVIVEGIDTMQACEELASRGLLDYDCHYVINGDATARAKSTKSLKSDYDIIKKFLSNYRTKKGFPISFEMAVPKTNPPIKTRHALVRAYQRSESKKVRTIVYKDCPVLNRGFKLTALKKGGHYIEDDSKEYQHVTTAAGYGICYIHNQITGSRSGLTKRAIR